MILLEEEICVGDIYDFFGILLSVVGEYMDMLVMVDGCDSIILLFFGVLLVLEVNIVGDMVFCLGEFLLVFVVNMMVGIYQWSIGVISFVIIIGSVFSSVSVMVMDNNGCIVVDSVDIIVDGGLMIIFSGNIFVCGIGIMEIVVSGGVFY